MALALRSFNQPANEQYFAPNETRVMLARELINAGVGHAMPTVEDLYLLVCVCFFGLWFCVCV